MLECSLINLIQGEIVDLMIVVYEVAVVDSEVLPCAFYQVVVEGRVEVLTPKSVVT